MGGESNSVETGLQQVRASLEGIAKEMVLANASSQSAWLDALARSGAPILAMRDAQGAVSETFGLPSAPDRIIAYLGGRVGEVVTRSELVGVSGIQEYARRIRELRTEHGWSIESLPDGAYRLLSECPDPAAVERWRLAKEIRGQKGGGGKRALALLRAIYPAVADKDQLQYVAKIPSYSRRLREYIEQGWQISTSDSDSTLRAGSYRLESLEMLPSRERKHIKLRMEILDRDDHACQLCGRAPKNGDDVNLQVHHIRLVAAGGTNDASNLVTLCMDCHAGRHAVDGKPNRSVRDELLHPESEPPTVVQS